METVHIDASRIKILAHIFYFTPLAALFLVLLVMGTVGLARETVRGLGIEFIVVWLMFVGLWFIELLLINSCLSMISNLFLRQPRVTLDRRGVEDTWLGVGVVDWVDIKRVALGGYRNVASIDLHVINRQKYVNRMSRWDRVADRILHPRGGADKLSIHYGCFKGRASKVHKTIANYRKARLHGVR